MSSVAFVRLCATLSRTDVWYPRSTGIEHEAIKLVQGEVKTLNAGRSSLLRLVLEATLISTHELVRDLSLKGFQKLSCPSHILRYCMEKC